MTFSFVHFRHLSFREGLGEISMKSEKKVIRVALAILCMVSMLFISEYQKVEVYAASGYGFIFLSAYEKTLKIGDTYCLSVVSSGSKKPTFTSSDSRSYRLIPTEKLPQKRREVRRSLQKAKMRRQAARSR